MLRPSDVKSSEITLEMDIQKSLLVIRIKVCEKQLQTIAKVNIFLKGHKSLVARVVNFAEIEVAACAKE